MKKLLAVLLTAVLMANLFAQAESGDSKLDSVRQVIDEEFKTDEGKAKVYELSADLTSDQKGYLYQDFKKRGVGPFFLNLGLGFGIGSFVQGDTKGGKLQLFMDLGGFGLIAGGYGLMYSSYHEGTRYTLYPTTDFYTGKTTYRVYPEYYDDTDPKKWYGGIACVSVGSALVTVASIIGYVRPWIYAVNWNQSLRRSLRIEETPLASVETNLVPIIDPFNSKYGLVAQLKL